ncbi:hypothetical protein SEVIR_4G072100v4 [Setaria viridis]|uniref:Uncharacterized protein n=2 Tax=Setaria TaxID=4554 RepID=A0A368QS05_SETIT|nr:uncharacterized protein LOC117854040 [Setaria viridis]RCV20653.1 hypothetical protein SETIT_4G074300v2 [Setaria italica]TKW20226.1 hypothetical protein SEVIR_4G072100v2 [Setaria viridis]
MDPAGAAVVPPPPPPAATVPPAGAAARPAWTRLSARMAWATALFVLGCAAASLAFFAMTLPRADDSRLLGSCAPTEAEAAGLRVASEKLLLAASAQVLAGTAALLVPARPVAAFGCLLGWLTSYHATDVLWMLVACHGHAHGVLAFHFWVFFIMLFVVLAVSVVVSVIG